MSVQIKEIEEIKDVVLTKINGEILAELKPKYVSSISKYIKDIDKVELDIPKYILKQNKGKMINPVFMHCKHERFICINNKEIYTIKDISKNNNTIHISAKSRETSLQKMDLKFEDIGFKLQSKNEEKNIYSLDEYMYEQTGWKFGYIDNKVKFQDDGITEKMRWQESVVGYWYDFLVNTISEQFECVVVFDSYNKKVNLYDIDGFGGGVQISLNKDNYMKDIEIQSGSNDIITRLRLEGNSGLSIKEGVPSGQDYIENYSYFMDNKEMSNGLIAALYTYEEMVKKRTPIWRDLISEKIKKESELTKLKHELGYIISSIKSNEGIYNQYKARDDEENMAIIGVELGKLRDNEVILDLKIEDLEGEIERLTYDINEITILCQKPTARDDNNELIFTEEMLDELKNYIFTDTFSDDAYLEVEDLLKAGVRKLELNSKPIYSWSVDVVDFTKRIIDNNFRQNWKGRLGLGDIVILYDKEEDSEELVFITSFTKNIKNGELDIELSNYKLKEDDTRVIADLLTETKKISTLLRSKRYLLIEQQKKRINLKHAKGGVLVGADF